MKRFVFWLLIAVAMISVLPGYASAQETDSSTIYYKDGAYAEIEIVSNNSRTSGSVTGSKKYTYYNSDDTELWKVVLTGKFTYTGSSSSCTSSSVDVTIYNTSWYTRYKNASKSGNAAKASVTMGQKLEGELVMTVPVNLKLTCDSSGNLS